MKYRKPRIAWSLVCGMVGVVLIVLWARSYSRLEEISGSGRNANSVSTIKGSLIVNSGGFTFSADEQGDGAMTFSNRKPLAGGRFYFSTTSGISDLDYTTRGDPWTLPLWVCVGAAGALLALPWLPWSARFSLRTLLLMITLSAIAAGAIAYFSRE